MFHTDLHEEIGGWATVQVINKRRALNSERERMGRNPRVMTEQAVVAAELARRGIK